ncbi:hypothetical protein [Sulfurimonas sp. HSL3-7]|uniref:hypothetical protein n=1 Tax=Sulfonitrofixus jiaomeiensis TaxID=3131938 RepID=UPI0031F84C77
MRPKGFGKRYFTLSSILAHAVAPTLHSQITRASAHQAMLFDDNVSIEEDPPDEELSALSCLFNDKPCHCNCYFNRLTRRILLFVKLLSTQACHCLFYSHRRTGTHPPLSFSF